jgi:ABC-type nitrate/sulfonate/bicarbonate transport system substrate-binding protein
MRANVMRLFLAVLLLTPGAAGAAEKLRVAKPEATTFAFALLDVGMAAGIFAKNGLEIESFDLAGAGKSHQALVAGSVDIELGSGVEFIFIAKGSPTKGIAAMAGPPLSMSIIVRADGDITKVADLKGKRIGVTTVGSLTDWLARQLAVSQGWGPNGVLPTSVGNMDGQTAALMAKNVDAVVGPTERGYPMEAAGRGKVLVTFGKAVPDFIIHMILATDATLKNDPDKVRRFLKAWFETVAYVKTHKAETIKYSAEATRMPPDIASKVYDEQMPMFSTTGRFDPKAVAVIKQSLIDMGAVTTVPDDSKLYTEEFLP